MSPHFAYSFFFFFNDTATTEIYTLSLHDALPISRPRARARAARRGVAGRVLQERGVLRDVWTEVLLNAHHARDRAVAGASGAGKDRQAGNGGGGLGRSLNPNAARPSAREPRVLRPGRTTRRPRRADAPQPGRRCAARCVRGGTCRPIDPPSTARCPRLEARDSGPRRSRPVPPPTRRR